MAVRGAGAFPIAAICCLALILLAIASTIVLALIPVYLARRDIAVGAINSQQTTADYSVPLSSSASAGLSSDSTGPLSSSETAKLSSDLQGAIPTSEANNGGLTVQSAEITSDGRRKRRASGRHCIMHLLFFGRNRAFLLSIKRLFEAYFLLQLAIIASFVESILNSRTVTSASTSAAVSTTASSAVSTAASGRRRRNIFLRRQAQQAALAAPNTYKD
jgi:hypothetical protein